MKGRTQIDRLEKLMQKHQVYDHYLLALPLVEVQSGALQRIQEGNVILLSLKYLSLVLMEGQRVRATLMPMSTQGDRFEVTSVTGKYENIEASSKHRLLIFVLNKIERKSVKVGDIINVANISFDKIDILVDSKKIARGSLVNVEGKIALQIDKVEKR